MIRTLVTPFLENTSRTWFFIITSPEAGPKGGTMVAINLFQSRSFCIHQTQIWRQKMFDLKRLPRFVTHKKDLGQSYIALNGIFKKHLTFENRKWLRHLFLLSAKSTFSMLETKVCPTLKVTSSESTTLTIKCYKSTGATKIMKLWRSWSHYI